MNFKTIPVSFLILFGVVFHTTSWAHGVDENAFAPNVDMKTGAIHVPDGYRQWATLGTWAHANTKGKRGSSEYHIVYTQPETIQYYKQHGEFPDGAVLVKELIHAETMKMTTGPAVSHATTIKGWFVLIRDKQGRFKESPLWGDGWGWSFFNASNPMATASKNYKEDCIACHVPARSMAPADANESDKWVYTFGYPVLKEK